VIEEPDIPPLESTSGSSSPPINLALYAEAPAKIATTVSNETVKEITPVGSDSEDRQNSVAELAERVRLRGEVLANDERGGPRLVIDVEALDSAGARMQFAGTLSLMLLVPDGGEEPENLARWDFSAAEVHEAIDPLDFPAMRFYLELPSETAVTDPAELWVRLVMPDETKLLTHAEVNLIQPSQFASMDDMPEEPVDDEAGQIAASVSPTRSAPEPRPMVLDEGWTIARPGEPAGSEEADIAESAWRASSEPILAVVQEATRASRVVESTRQSHTREQGSRPPAPAYKRPTWTADRPASSNSAQLTAPAKNGSPRPRPAWSATR
jgi:hypothetical protein